ncbi:hypothetical protein BSKO_06458 [Bryopsis sp. KO-2023]|nr:hypothetical protein BSKO_06458 [Bryopsis sp. KO-2023]
MGGKAGTRFSPRVGVRISAAICALVLAAVVVCGSDSIDDVQTHRRLHQAKKSQVVRITKKNSKNFKQTIEKASNGTIFEMQSKQTIEISEMIVVTAPITLRADGKGEKPIIKCTAPGANLQIRSPDVTLEGFVIRDCEATAVQILLPDEDGFKCGLRTAGPTMNVEIENVDFVKNKVQQGFPDCTPGGGSVGVGTGCRVAITECLFESNTAFQGAGVYMQLGAAVTIANSTFRENEAVDKGAGPAIFAGVSNVAAGNDSGLYVQNCEFIQNRNVDGRIDKGGLKIKDGSNLEASNFVRFETPASSGGAIHVSGLKEVQVTGSTFEGNSAVPAGGAMYITDNDSIFISNCTFRGNQAKGIGKSQETADDRRTALGGALYVALISTRSELKIHNCNFEDNFAGFGGALHLVTSAGVSDKVPEIVSTEFTNNKAHGSGGAIAVRNSNKVIIKAFRMIKNEAHEAGGGLYVTNGAVLTLVEGTFSDNIATDGGGMYCFGSGGIQMTGSVNFYRNKAMRNGGALGFAESLASTIIKLVVVEIFDNVARRGGAIYVDSISKFELRASTGGLLAVGDEKIAEEVRQRVELTNRPSLRGNKAEAGGALYIRSASQIQNIVDVDDVLFLKNQAVRDITGELRKIKFSPETLKHSRSLLDRQGRFAEINRRQGNRGELINPLDSDPCAPGGGGAICLVLNQVPEQATADIAVTRAHFEKNRAYTGGGIFISTQSELDWVDHCTTLSRCHSLAITGNVTFQDNFASDAGGAMFVTHPENVFFSPKDQGKRIYTPMSELDAKKPKFVDLVDNTEVEVSTPSFSKNTVGAKGFGGNFASIAKTLEFNNGSSSDGYIAKRHASGQVVDPMTVLVKDFFDNKVTAGITDAELKVEAVSPHVLGQQVATTNKGQVLFDAVRLTAEPGDYPLTFTAPRVKNVTVRYSIRTCNVGEFNLTQNGICSECVEGFVGFQPEFPCDRCMANAHCPGGPVLLLDDGFWHSTPYSDQLHECLVDGACSYNNRRERLHEFYKNVNDLKPSRNHVENDVYPLCNTGYEGVLCGSCQLGYGHLGGGECSSCGDSKAANVLKVVVVAFWNLGLMLFTMRSAISAIKNLKEVHFMEDANARQAAQGDANRNVHITIDPDDVDEDDDDDDVIVRDLDTDGNPAPPTVLPETGPAAVDLREEVPMEKAPMEDIPMEEIPGQPTRSQHILQLTQPTGLVTADHIIGAENISETLKIATNFLQVTSIALQINVKWTESIAKMLLAQDALTSFSGGSSATPLDCILTSDPKNRSIQSIILRIFFPIIIMCFVIFLLYVVLTYRARKRSKARKFKQYSIIAIIVALFFAYENVTQDIMRIMNCVEYSTLNTLEGTSLVVSIFTFYSGIIYNDPNTSMTARGLFSAMLLVLNVCLVGLFVWRVWKSLDLVVTARLRNLRQAVPDGVYARFTKLAAVYAAMAREKTRGKASSMMVRMKRKTERRIEESDVAKPVS